MSGPEFVESLKAECERALSKLAPESAASAVVSPEQFADLLRAALKNEMEAAAVAAEWVATTPPIEAKLALARHAGDEARHYELLADRIRMLGMDFSDFNPLEPPSPVLQFLRTLTAPEERIAAALVARGAMGHRRNLQFLALLESAGRHDIAQIYRDVINPDEERHHRAGCALLARMAATPDTQKRARAAALRLLETGDAAREAFIRKTGLPLVPGC